MTCHCMSLITKIQELGILVQTIQSRKAKGTQQKAGYKDQRYHKYVIKNVNLGISQISNHKCYNMAVNSPLNQKTQTTTSLPV